MTRRVLIDAAFVVKNVGVLRQSILDAFEEDDTISLDLVDEQSVDLCGLQLIESARRQAASAGKTLVLERPGTDFRHVLEFWLHEGTAQ